ncbi:VOC family protein [Nonomuraea sp. NPDC004580]|uniref:VOC family protein n=1 Tax=Nonomuraea sp. NPDC004580 TaxID=3154552 RepID=UPI00339F1576
MPFTLASIIIDTADLEPESTFWHRLLGGTLTVTPTHHFLQPDGLPVIVIQLAPGHVPPTWPDPGVPQQLHIDLRTADLTTADRQALDAGARRLRTSATSNVYTSPSGHPFCLRQT